MRGGDVGGRRGSLGGTWACNDRGRQGWSDPVTFIAHTRTCRAAAPPPPAAMVAAGGGGTQTETYQYAAEPKAVAQRQKVGRCLPALPVLLLPHM